jgi:hypothetical protein
VAFVCTFFVQVNPFESYQVLMMMLAKVLFCARYHAFDSVKLKLLLVRV